MKAESQRKKNYPQLCGGSAGEPSISATISVRCSIRMGLGDLLAAAGERALKAEPVLGRAGR
jgi:hypothetical protein